MNVDDFNLLAKLIKDKSGLTLTKDKAYLLESRLLPVARKPVFVKIGQRVGLGYRRNATAGTWVVRVADGKGGNWTKTIAIAEDTGFRIARRGCTLLPFSRIDSSASGMPCPRIRSARR